MTHTYQLPYATEHRRAESTEKAGDGVVRYTDTPSPLRSPKVPMKVNP